MDQAQHLVFGDVLASKQKEGSMENKKETKQEEMSTEEKFKFLFAKVVELETTQQVFDNRLKKLRQKTRG